MGKRNPSAMGSAGEKCRGAHENSYGKRPEQSRGWILDAAFTSAVINPHPDPSPQPQPTPALGTGPCQHPGQLQVAAPWSDAVPKPFWSLLQQSSHVNTHYFNHPTGVSEHTSCAGGSNGVLQGHGSLSSMGIPQGDAQGSHDPIQAATSSSKSPALIPIQ